MCGPFRYVDLSGSTALYCLIDNDCYLKCSIQELFQYLLEPSLAFCIRELLCFQWRNRERNECQDIAIKWAGSIIWLVIVLCVLIILKEKSRRSKNIGVNKLTEKFQLMYHSCRVWFLVWVQWKKRVTTTCLFTAVSKLATCISSSAYFLYFLWEPSLSCSTIPYWRDPRRPNSSPCQGQLSHLVNPCQYGITKQL